MPFTLQQQCNAFKFTGLKPPPRSKTAKKQEAAGAGLPVTKLIETNQNQSTFERSTPTYLGA